MCIVGHSPKEMPQYILSLVVCWGSSPLPLQDLVDHRLTPLGERAWASCLAGGGGGEGRQVDCVYPMEVNIRREERPRRPLLEAAATPRCQKLVAVNASFS